MKESIQKSTDNLVMFPAAKNFPVESNAKDLMADDPLEALLNEFSHLPSEEDIYDEDELIEPEKPVHQKMGQLDRILLIHSQLKELEETTSRMKFLIDEIEDFLPRKKKSREF